MRIVLKSMRDTVTGGPEKKYENVRNDGSHAEFRGLLMHKYYG